MDYKKEINKTNTLINKAINKSIDSVGNPDMRSKLTTDDKLVSYGIYFDVNSYKVKPKSFATHKTNADILKENVGIKITMIGHSDSGGNDLQYLLLPTIHPPKEH